MAQTMLHAGVEPVHTQYRTIRTTIPHPDSLPVLKMLRRAEPRCMEGQPPVVWDRAEGATVYDAHGNQWIDFSSGVLITNAGHGPQAMVDAIKQTAHNKLLTAYCFPHKVRAELTDLLQQCAPRKDDKVMLLSTGSEAIELTIKLSREYAHQKKARNKNVVVGFHNAFHGRTMGAQLAGGVPSLKQWIGYPDKHFVQVPFPDGVRCDRGDLSFDSFEQHLRRQRVTPDAVCAVLTETYQGGNASFAPPPYVQALRKWCDKHRAVLIMDEVQAGFGRTGRLWGYEHYGIVPDLIACGKGISGALPLSAVIGRKELMDLFPPGSMTSTHSGNPVCCAAAVANLKILLEQDLTGRAARIGRLMQDAAHHVWERYSDRILAHHGKGMVAALHCVRPRSDEPDAQLANDVVHHAVQRGVMLFAPVGFGGASVKLCPPLVIEAEALREGMGVIEEAFAQALGNQTRNSKSKFRNRSK